MLFNILMILDILLIKRKKCFDLLQVKKMVAEIKT